LFKFRILIIQLIDYLQRYLSTVHKKKQFGIINTLYFYKESDSLNYHVYNSEGEIENERIVEFLYSHLGKYGDDKEKIGNAIEYAMDSSDGKGGFIVTANEEDELIGVVVVNDTAMEGYIPRHILVYIAVHREYRGKGVGKNLIKKVVELCTGNIALHVEYDNPARLLYKKLGFKSKYAEMRFEQLDEASRINEMYKRIVKNGEIKPELTRKRIKKVMMTFNRMKDEELHVILENDLYSLIDDIVKWDEIFKDKKSTLSSIAKIFKDLINIPYDQQVLLNKIKSEMLNAIGNVIESNEWEYYLDEFHKLKNSVKIYEEKS